MQELLETLATFGAQPEGGLIRSVYDPAWLSARQQLERWFAAAGLETRVDAVGNLFGRVPGAQRRTVLTGSHIDTVRLGGAYDGALGVLAGFAAVRAIARVGAHLPRAVEVVALCEEEDSRYHGNFWGTRGILGLIEPRELTELVDLDGVRIDAAMQAVGLDPARFAEARRTDLAAFIELHIEQGRILFDEQVPLGIVETITGIYRFQVTVTGRADHAGTTPMDVRVDALQAAAAMAREMTGIVAAAGRPAVLTNGWWDVQPGAWNIVPERVRFSVDLRHPDDAAKHDLATRAMECAERIARAAGVAIEFEVAGDIAPRDMDPTIRAALERAADTAGVAWKPMVSGAGHDSQVMATGVPTAMLFVPSVEGRSHSRAEFTSPEDAARGATILAQALFDLASRED
jgi:allantoate deiminase